jgi:hypothetical protein
LFRKERIVDSQINQSNSMNLNEIPSSEQQSPRVDINAAEWAKCTCGGMVFTSAVMVKRISPLLSPTGKEEIAPLDIIVCKTCDKIPPFYVKMCPVELPAEIIDK